jgi:hypothetical protein
MELTGLSFENYKPFASREDVEIRPLTLLVGRNSSGKSAVARLPLLLGRAVSDDAEAPLDLAVEGVDFGASLLDVIHNRVPHGAVTIGAKFSDERDRVTEFRARIQHVSEYMLQIVSEFELITPGRDPVRITWDGRDPLASPGHYSCNGMPSLVTFAGIFPNQIGFPDNAPGAAELATHIFETHDVIQRALKPVSYLGAFREPPKRTYLFPGGLPQSVGASGVTAAALLGADYLRRRGVVLDAVGRWASENLGGWPLAVTRQGDSFALVLRDPEDPAVEVNVTDAGTGVTQVLPLVVQRVFEEVTGRRSALEIVEQPELHLHPAAQVSLADLYVRAVKEHQRPRFIIETHSENLLLRVRRHVAEGTLDPEKVIVYWVNDLERDGTRLEPIFIYRNGDVSSWPTGVFAEDFVEVAAIRKAQDALR